MTTSIVMPKLGFVMEEGTIVEWLKEPGDSITKGELLLVIESEKATMEIESPGTGILGPDLAPPGTKVPIATVIGYILEPGEAPPSGPWPWLAGTVGEEEPFEGPKTERAAPEGEPKEAITSKGPKVRASPIARRLAREHGVDLARIEGSGPQGRILEKDVLAYVEAQAGAAEEDVGPVPPAASEMLAAEWVELSSIQRITAERMSASFRTAPHFYLTVHVDMSAVVAMREALLPTMEASAGIRLSFSDILLRVAAQALKEHPALNATFEDGRLKRFQQINLGLATDTPRGLVVPVFHQADRLSLSEIARRRVDLLERAGANKLSPDDLSGGTFTVSNLGMFGIDVFNAIINPPQAAILAVGRITKRPLVVDDALQVRPTMWLTLSVDHRAADGATAARFLQTLVRYLEEPYQLLV
jgi:pyruvate dehydrogenase E2 component (dihydrolipoamide acetyltransferase)